MLSKLVFCTSPLVNVNFVSTTPAATEDRCARELDPRWGASSLCTFLLQMVLLYGWVRPGSAMCLPWQWRQIPLVKCYWLRTMCVCGFAHIEATVAEGAGNQDCPSVGGRYLTLTPHPSCLMKIPPPSKPLLALERKPHWNIMIALPAAAV